LNKPQTRRGKEEHPASLSWATCKIATLPEEVQRLGVKVVSISGAKGKKLIEAQQWKSRPYRQARAERSAIESLVFTLKEGFEFGEMARRTHENVLAEMLEKMLAYNISQIIRLRKKLSEPEQTERTAA
jgi:hypothetical protein